MIRLTVKVIPKSGRSALKFDRKTLKAWLTSAPEDGKANAELVRRLADILDVPKSSIEIVRGSTARIKTVDITGITIEDVEKSLR